MKIPCIVYGVYNRANVTCQICPERVLCRTRKSRRKVNQMLSQSVALHLLPSKLRKLKRKYAGVMRCGACGNTFQGETHCPACHFYEHNKRLPLWNLTLQEILAEKQEQKKYRFLDRTKAIHYADPEDDIGAMFAACCHPLDADAGEDPPSNTLSSDPKKVTCKKCLKHIEYERQQIKKILAGERDFVGLGYYLKTGKDLSLIPQYACNLLDDNQLSSGSAFQSVVLAQALFKRIAADKSCDNIPAPTERSVMLKLTHTRSSSDWYDNHTVDIDLTQIQGFTVSYLGEDNWSVTAMVKQHYHFGLDISLSYIHYGSLVEVMLQKTAPILSIHNCHTTDCFQRDLAKLMQDVLVKSKKEPKVLIV